MREEQARGAGELVVVGAERARVVAERAGARGAVARVAHLLGLRVGERLHLQLQAAQDVEVERLALIGLAQLGLTQLGLAQLGEAGELIMPSMSCEGGGGYKQGASRKGAVSDTQWMGAGRYARGGRGGGGVLGGGVLGPACWGS